MWLDVLFTIFLVFLNGFFVAAEFAIVKVRSSQIQVKAGNSFLGKVAESIVDNLDGYLAATQLGITLASLGLGWVGEEVVSSLILKVMHFINHDIAEQTAHTLALPIAFGTITVLHIVFGELAPKSLAIRYPTSTTLYLSVPLKVFYFVFRPFIWMLNGLANLLLRVLGIRPAGHDEIHSEDELKLIISESAEGGAIKSSERELIQNVFDFDDRIVKQILVPAIRISALPASLTLKAAITKSIEEGFSRFPVYEESMENIIGIIHTKDLLKAEVSGKEIHSLRDLLRPVTFVPQNIRVIDLLRMFQQKKSQMAVVTNEFGGIAGIVTMEDVIEELVGEIQDEYDNESPIVEKTAEFSYRIQAQSSLADINEYLPEPFPLGEDYETLAGFINTHLQGIPQLGQEFTFENYKVKVVRLFRTSAEVVQVNYEPQEAD